MTTNIVAVKKNQHIYRYFSGRF